MTTIACMVGFRFVYSYILVMAFMAPVLLANAKALRRLGEPWQHSSEHVTGPPRTGCALEVVLTLLFKGPAK